VVTDGTTGTTAVANEGSTTTTQAATTGTADATTQTAAATAATAADVKKGVSVYDQAGGLVGTIDSVSADAAVVSTGKVKATIPLTSFGKNDKGLVLVMSKAELEAAAKTP
jgi:preprotein translocase subunit YajC